jgi:hypothetical protein
VQLPHLIHELRLAHRLRVVPVSVCVLGNRLFLQFPLQHHQLRGPVRLRLERHRPSVVLGNGLALQLPHQHHHMRRPAGLHLDDANSCYVQRNSLFMQLTLFRPDLPAPAGLRLGFSQCLVHRHRHAL